MIKNNFFEFSLYSGPKDHVFVYFTDHGAPGLLAFPDDDVSIWGDYFGVCHKRKKKIYLFSDIQEY